MTGNKTSRKKSCEDKSLFQKIFGKVDELLHTGIDVFTLFPYEADFGIKSRFDRYSSHMFKLGHHAREEETAAAVLFKKTQCRVNLTAVHDDIGLNLKRVKTKLHQLILNRIRIEENQRFVGDLLQSYMF